MIESFLSTTFAYDGLQREVSQTDGRGNTTRGGTGGHSVRYDCHSKLPQ